MAAAARASRRSPGPRGRRRDPRGQHAVGRYRDPGLLLGATYRRRRLRPPATPASAATCRSRWSTRRAWTSSRARVGVVLLAGAETWRTRTTAAGQGQQAGLDRRRTSRCRCAEVPTTTCRWPGPPSSGSSLDRPAYVYPLFEQALRIANGESLDDHRRRIGELWARFNAVAGDNPHAWIRKPVTAEEIAQPGPQQPDDQLALHQADELQQHGRPGRGADPDVGGEGDTPADPRRPLGFPVRGHRRARHLSRSPSARSCTGRRPSGSPARGRWNWPAWRSTTSTTSTCTRASRPRSRSRPPNSASRRRSRPPADGHRRPDLRGRPVEQLRHALHRHHGRAAGRQPRAARPDHRQRRLPDQAQLRRLRHRAASAEFRWEDVQSAVDREPTGRGGGVGGRRHRRSLDDAVQPGRTARKGLPGGPHTRTTRAPWR